MKSVKFLGWASMLLLLFVVGCRDDNFIDNTGKNTPELQLLINTDLNILVTDEQGNLIESAKVDINGQIASTNELGVVSYDNTNMNGSGQIININKAGYYNIQKVIYPTTAEKTITVRLMEKTMVGNFSSNSGGLVQTTDGASASFDANSIKNADGSLYSGQVNVYARWLNPSADNLPYIMPGNLRALNSDEEQVQLATYGMMAVELESPSGAKLNIADGYTAELTFPLPSDLQSSAPSTIPLWSYNTDNGFWVEEGSANKQGDKYVGKVSHFSYWNCDAPFPTVNFEATIVDANGNPMDGVSTTIEVVSNGFVGYGWSDEDGVVKGKIPKDEELVFKINNNCGETVLEFNIGPFSQDIVYTPDIVVDLGPDNMVEITGTLVDCDGVVIENGIGIINMNFPMFVDIESDGTFSRTVLTCNTLDGSFQAYDLDEGLVSEKVNFTLDGSSSTYDLGNVEVCETADEYITVTTDYPIDLTFLLLDVSYYPGSNINMSGFGADSSSVYLYFEDLVPGTYTDVVEETGGFDQDNNISYNLNSQASNTLVITKNEGIGGYLEGNLAGEFFHTDNGTVVLSPGTIEFKVILK